MNNTHQADLRPTKLIDSDHPLLREFVNSHTASSDDARTKAVKLFYAVRDGIRYDPYRFLLNDDGFRASTTIQNQHGWCVPKAVALAAVCRTAGIPARIGFADVKNHLSTARMRQAMGTDVFYWHGYTAIWLDDRWVKATPAFNIELCQKFRLKPLEFDGLSDSLYHPFDLEGREHMQYLRYRGEFNDVPLQEMLETYKKEYTFSPLVMQQANFELDVNLESEVTADGLSH